MRIKYQVLLALGFSCSLLTAMLPVFEPWLEMIQEKALSKSIKFSGLEFSFADSFGACVEQREKVICTLSPAFGPQAEMVFEKVMIKGLSSLGLLRLKRKRLWQRSHKTLIEYKEVPYNTGLGNLLGQSAKVYHLDNIQRPVLLRAFDVVINDKTCISISTKCGFEQGPLLEKEVAQVLSSFKITAQN